MRIGIDISQTAYEGTGVGNFVKNLVENLITKDTQNEYVLFFSSMRRALPNSKYWSKDGKPNVESLPQGANVRITQFKLPPTVLDLLWNRLHILNIELFIGPVDVFLSSDWVQPPTRAKKVTILYDLIVYKYPDETAKSIIAVQKRRLKWVTKEVDKIICISDATKKDAQEIFHIPSSKLSVVYPG